MQMSFKKHPSFRNKINALISAFGSIYWFYCASNLSMSSSYCNCYSCWSLIEFAQFA